MLHFGTPLQLAENDPKNALDTGLDADLDRIQVQSQIEEDIMKADGTYFVPVDSVDSGAVVVDVMTSVTDTTSDTKAGNGSGYTEVSFKREFSENVQKRIEDEPKPKASLKRSDQPRLEQLVQLVEEQTKRMSAVDRKLSDSDSPGAPSLLLCY